VNHGWGAQAPTDHTRLLAIADCNGRAVLHYATHFHSYTAVLECLVREYPLALFATTNVGNTPLQTAIFLNRPAPIRNLLTDTAAPLASHNFAALAFPLGHITRTCILICLRRLTYSPDPDPPTSLVRYAHAILPHDMWSEILSYMCGCE